MRLTRILPAAAVIAAALSLAGVAPASAMVLWCESDPPIQVLTPGGTTLTVNNMVYVARYDMHLNTHFPASATAVSDAHGGTLITVNVQIALGVSQAHVVSSENRFQISSPGDGTGGTVVTTYLDVPIT
ncbi:MAG TPA: hypothetical protein VF956_10140 [Candidatus Dormibacteraeota bacterium]